ncbi:MAG: hypothetical protein Q4C70_10850 [Planctomycetia bacterium]|nr:hypothetical protein [Planctomycetia bacterium]
MSTQAIQAGEAFIQLNIRSDELQRSLNNVGSKIDEFGAKTVSTLSTIRSALGESIEDGGQFGDAISVAGQALETFSVGFGYVNKMTTALDRATVAGRLFTFQQNQQAIATRLNAMMGKQNIITQTTSTVVSYAAATGIKVLTAAQSILNTVLFACPLTWITSGLLAVGGATFGIIKIIGSFSNELEDSAKAMEELRKRNDEYRESARSAAGILEELAQKGELNAQQSETSSAAYKSLETSCKQLEINLVDMGISFDENTKKVDGSAESFAKLRETMRVKEFQELNKEIKAQSEYLDNLKSKLDKNGETGYLRWWGGVFSFGYVDNAEEIQAKIDETQKKIAENVQKSAEVMDYSEIYKENEEKLKEWEKADVEATQTATQKKIAAIREEMTARKEALAQMITEAKARNDVTQEEIKALEEKQKALANSEKTQIENAKKEEADSIQKIQDDMSQKRNENAENKSWKESLKDPMTALSNAITKSESADDAFQKAIDARKNIGENATAAEIAKLDEEIKKAQKEAEKWYSRKAEAEETLAKAAEEEHEKAFEWWMKAAEEEAKAAEEARKKTEERLQSVNDMKVANDERREKAEEEKAWNEKKENDTEGASKEAQEQYNNLISQRENEYNKLQNLAISGNEEDYQAQLKKVQEMESGIDLWQKRLEDLNMEPMEQIQNGIREEAESPQTLMAGSMDTQKKFWELQQKSKNPLEDKVDKTNQILNRVATYTEEVAGGIYTV